MKKISGKVITSSTSDGKRWFSYIEWENGDITYFVSSYPTEEQAREWGEKALAERTQA